MDSLKAHFNKSLGYLKLGDKESFVGNFISWEPIVTKFGKKAYRFNLERSDGSRVSWDTGNSRAILQFAELIEKGLKKDGTIKIYREGLDKDNTRYTITEQPPF